MNYLAFALLVAISPTAEPVPGHRLIAQDKGHVAIVDAQGKVEWEVPSKFTAHDIQVLPNGNVIFPTAADTLVEMTPEKKIIWKHVSKPKDGYKGKVEIHGFQRLADGLTMVPETGNLRIVEVDHDDKVVKEVPLTVKKPDSHRDIRMARKLDSGNYLVCHEGDGTVREYDPAGKVVWSYALDLAGRERTPTHQGHGTEVFGAVRLATGNTLIAGGNNNRVLEVTPSGQIVWKIDQDELPGVKLFWVTTLQVLPNGHIIVGNTHAGPDKPATVRGHPRQEGGLDLQGLEKLRQ